VLSLAGCGGSGGGSTSAESTATAAAQPHALPKTTILPGDVVARVGQDPITLSSFERQLAIDAAEAGTPLSTPPGFAGCVTYLKDAAAQVPAGNASLSTGALKARCEAQYASLQRQALGELISARWLLGESAEEGRPANATVARAQFERVKRKFYPKPAEFARFLASSHKTVPGLLAEFEVSEATANIRQHINSRVDPISKTMIADYYDSHRRSYSIPQQRNVKIIRTLTEGEALQVKQKIESGQSFADAVSHSHLEQPIFSSKGLTTGLVPGFYKEKPLNDAIFAARPDVLSGPVKISLGYYVFEVKSVLPPRQRALAEVESTIRQQLAALGKQQTMTRFVRVWRAKWTARTDCSPGYVVPKCSQFKGRNPTPESPDALD
jgi:hypothetical protein